MCPKSITAICWGSRDGLWLWLPCPFQWAWAGEDLINFGKCPGSLSCGHLPSSCASRLWDRSFSHDQTYPGVFCLTSISPLSWTCSRHFCYVSWPLHGVGCHKWGPRSDQGGRGPTLPLTTLGRGEGDPRQDLCGSCSLLCCAGGRQGGEVSWQPFVTSSEEGVRPPAAGSGRATASPDLGVGAP